MKADTLFQEVSAVALTRGWRQWSDSMVVVEIHDEDLDNGGLHYEGFCLTWAGECVRLEIYDQDGHLSTISWNVKHFKRIFELATGEKLTTELDSIEKLRESILDKIKPKY